MGSSSKKTKSSKEGSRKRRHRSRSNSDDSSREKDKERHRHRRHHKERRHDKSSKQRDYDSEGSDNYPPSPQQSRERDETPPQSNRSESPTNNQAVESLSIDDTNKLRAKLGLKPLEVHSSSSRDTSDSKNKDDNKFKDDLGEFYHKPAGNIAEKTKQEKLRSRLSEKKEKRQIESKLSKVKTLGDSDSEEDAESWVEKNRRIQHEKEQAAKRAKMLEELDEEFGIGDIVESETKLKKAKVYSDKHLRGLKVEHDVKHFAEGKSVILTLKDAEVLGEDGDVLVNVNMIDDERYEKSNEDKKKKPVYQPYQDDEFDEDGNPREKTLLSKYDEEIDGIKKSAFIIGESSEPRKSLALTVKEKLSNKRLESLVLPELNLASEYFTEEEMTKFKKPKKKVKKLRSKKILTAAELAASVELESKNDHGSRRRKPDLKSENGDESSAKGEFTEWMDIDDLPEMKPIMEGMPKIEPDDTNLERALHKARRLKQKEAITTLPAVESLIKAEPVEELSALDPGSIILNSTAEFCRSLGDIPTYGKAGNRDEDEDLMDFERENLPSSSEPTSSWNPVESTVSAADGAVVDPAGLDAPILDEEPDVGSGVGAALKLAMSKGYLDKEENNRPSSSKFAHLQARHYSIEDKTYGDDDKFGGRRERYSGPTMDFKEKDTFRPNVKLEYIDDEGRVLNPKEAFRYLSHKFHGKGPGKNKIEKRIKKTEQEGLMKKMSSTDTPLGTLNMLQHKQKEMQSPYIVLSGSKHTHSTTISKARR